MKLHIDKSHYIDTNSPIDISIPLSDSNRNPKAWYVKQPRFTPVVTDNYVGSVKDGGAVNFRDVFFNPHGHGTHTECLGHITEKVHSVNKVLNNYFFNAQVLSILPKRVTREDGVVDFIITKDQLSTLSKETEALIIRTLPNENGKLSKDYSSTNPPYFQKECVEVILAAGVKHLLVDLPSVDRENDNGELAFHHAFWEVPETPNFERTITELIFVKTEIKDGVYMLNLQTAPFENDAAPSRPVLYQIKKELIS
ncbi:MAG: cyclase family protein [Fluviicola sp.]|nr:cyclase family protein [Fluviicola sp.]